MGKSVFCFHLPPLYQQLLRSMAKVENIRGTLGSSEGDVWGTVACEQQATACLHPVPTAASGQVTWLQLHGFF